MRVAFALIIFISVQLHICGGDEIGYEEHFITSSPHRMLLRPVRGEMNRKTLRSLEDAIVSALTVQQLKEGNRDFFGNEVTVQEILHIEATSENRTDDSGSTSIQFIVTGITFLNRTEEQLQAQLGSLLVSTFTQAGSLRHFLFLLSSDPILGGASTVSVRPLPLNFTGTLDPMESNETPSRRISTVEIVLMCISGIILSLGIVYYLVAPQYIDRGYIENKCLVLFHRRPQEQAVSSGNSRNTSTTISGNVNHGDKDACRVTANASTAITAPEHCLSPYRRFLSENYQSKWSQPKHSLSRMRKNIAKSTTAFLQSDNENDSVEEFVFEDKSDDSVDLFNIGSSPGESKSLAASAVSEWMKTIRVVSRNVDQPGFVIDEEEQATRTMASKTIISPSVASSLNHTPSSALSGASSVASSSGFSTGTSSSGDSVLAEALSRLSHWPVDQVSLEQSMASSAIATNIKEKMEV